MKKITDIKQANIPIKEFSGLNGISSGNDMTHDEDRTILEYGDNGHISGKRSLPNVHDLESSVRDFVNNNKDNQAVDNPFKSDGTYDKVSDLVTAYNAGLALSHWDDIVAKHGDKINEVAKKADGIYENNVLSLGAASYVAESQGLGDKSIDLMLDKSINDYGFVSSYKMADTREMFNQGYAYDTVAFVLDKSTDESRYAVMNYLNHNDIFIDKDDIEMLGSVKSNSASLDISNMITDGDYSTAEIKDVISATNLYYNSLENKGSVMNKPELMSNFMEDVKAIKYYETEKYDIQRMEHPEIKLTDNQSSGIVFGENKLTNLVKDYIDNPDAAPNVLVHYHNKGLEFEQATPEKTNSFEHIKIPSGLIDGPHDSKYGKYDIISVPFEDRFGKMTVSDSLVDRNGKTAVLSLPSDRDRTVQFYDKETKEKTSDTFNVSDLKDIYNKNWERLNARNKSLDSKFESTQEFLANKFDSPEV